MTRLLLAVAIVCVFATEPRTAQAGGTTFVHVVRDGETLASIAQRYYGNPKRESVLVAENGLTSEGGAPIVTGMRLLIPWVGYHRVDENETWAKLAERFYGDARRANVLISANKGSPRVQPAEGQELLVPYPVRHVIGQNDTIAKLTSTYYGTRSRRKQNFLRRFNQIRSKKVARGLIVLVPLDDLTLSEEGRRIVEELTQTSVEGGEARKTQQWVESQMPTLVELGQRGEFAEVVALGNRLLGAGNLTGNQSVTIQRELARAFVAVGRDDLAHAAFREALRLQPEMKLGVALTSPTVLRAFKKAKEQLDEQEAAVDKAVTDAEGTAGDNGTSEE